MYIVYAIYNRSAEKFYIGQTNNLDERLRLHNEHAIPGAYTARFKGTWEVIYSEKCTTRVDALHRERELKSYKGRQFVKTHIPR